MKLLRNLKRFYILLMTVMLMSCGGGGEGEGESGSATTASNGGSESASPNNETTNTNTSDTAEFVIDTDFDLRSVEDVRVVVDIEAESDEKGYLSICHLRPNDAIDYENCVLRAKVVGNYYEGGFAKPAHVKYLAAALWFYDTSRAPIVTSISEMDMSDGEVIIN